MASSETVDRRLSERSLRRGTLASDQGSVPLEEMPDLSDNAEFPSDESVEQLANDLRAEKIARDLCIEKSLADPAAPEYQLAQPPVPIDFE